MSTQNKNLVHGIDLTAPDGIQMLMDFHRSTFGNATMQATEDAVSTDADATDTATVDVKPADGTKDATAAPNGVESDEDKTDWKAEAEKWKSLSRKNEEKAKSNLTRLTELETKATQFETDSETFKNLKVENLNLLKKIVATEAGIPTELIGRLQGSTEEELRADAEVLRPLFSGVTSKKSVQPVFMQGTDKDVDFTNGKIASYEDHINSLKNN